jgi:1-pyrroline-5-carboxylate dehydrogenase
MYHMNALVSTLARRAGAKEARSFASFAWSRFDPETLSGASPAVCANLVGGEWKDAGSYLTLPDPMNGEPFLKCPDTGAKDASELDAFVASLKSVPKSGLHNPLKNPERYVELGEVTARVVHEMRDDDVMDHFARLIQRVCPKSYAQARGEVNVTRIFLENFCGDQPRWLARGFTNPGDHYGQQSTGYRWPYGPVALIAPFNFPLEIPVLQMMGALYMGNKPLVHVDHRVSLVVEEFVRLLHECGLRKTDLDLLHGKGGAMGEIMERAKPRSTLFTGSRRVAERLARDHHGKVFLEDAGFDWKILGPDVQDFDHVVWQCDQDAYAATGQKCSAQSILFMHENWVRSGLEGALKTRAEQRNLADLTVAPVLSWTTDAMLDHAKRLLEIPGARVAWGAEPLTGHSIPDVYGAIKPTAIFVPLDRMLDDQYFDLVTTEVFGPFQVLTEYGDKDSNSLCDVLAATERMDAHLTAAVVSNDVRFVHDVLGNTVNGTTYVGMRGRTTGAPQNHWFGPAGDPRGAGIGTPEAIRLVWSCHREVIGDFGVGAGGMQS